MDHLESQVSDLESFLPGSVSSTVPPGGLLGPMVGGPPGPRGGREGNAHAAHALQPHGGGAGGGGRSTGTPSAYSALHGPNSAHAAPATVTPTTYSSAPIYTQQATQRAGPSNSRQGPGASPGAVDPGASASASASAGAKRRAEASAEEAAQKQQRSKRNRVTRLSSLVGCPSSAVEADLPSNLDSIFQSLGMFPLRRVGGAHASLQPPASPATRPSSTVPSHPIPPFLPSRPSRPSWSLTPLSFLQQ